MWDPQFFRGTVGGFETLQNLLGDEHAVPALLIWMVSLADPQIHG
jgi:hypothetical protein